MRFGDRDGLNRVYNRDGVLILISGEHVICEELNVAPTLKTTWGYFGGETLIEAETGIMYLTTHRLVFIGCPSGGIQRLTPKLEQKVIDTSVTTEIPGIKGVDTRYKHVREYFEILNHEVIACELQDAFLPKNYHINVYILADNKSRYHLVFVLPTSSKLVLRLKQKVVKNVDELVKKIKYYADYKDWAVKPVVAGSEEGAVEYREV